jgi:hypothetical protein
MNFMSLRVKPQKWISPSKTQYNDSIFEDKSFKFVFRVFENYASKKNIWQWLQKITYIFLIVDTVNEYFLL